MIAISGLTKTFGHTTVLAGIDLSIARGESIAIVGSDADGCRTLVRILATLVAPTSGRVVIDGLDVVTDLYRVRRLVAYADAGRVRPNRLRVVEYLRLVAGARWQPPSAAIAAANLVGLDADASIETLTDDLRQRLPFAAALAAATNLVLLDDTFGALDAPARDRVFTWLVAARERGTTVIAAANDPDVVEVCQRTVVLRAGRVATLPVSEALDRSASAKELVGA